MESLYNQYNEIIYLGIIAVIVLTFLLIKTSKDGNIKDFENNCCPYCNNDFRFSENKIKVTIIDIKMNKIFYACPKCYNGEETIVSDDILEYYKEKVI